MKEKKEKKLSKPIIILLTVSIVFLIIGVLDIKVNAEELSEYTVSVYSRRVVYSGTTVEDTYEDTYHTYTSSTPIYAYCTSNAISPLESGTAEASCFLISQSKFNNGCVSFTWNNETWYSMNYMTSVGVSDGQKITLEFYVSGCENKRIATCYTWNDFLTALQNDTLEFVIDYDSFEVDDNIPVIENIKTNRVKNWVSLKLYNQYFDYITWTSNDNYQIQIEKVFSVYFTRKVDGTQKFLGAEYNGSTKSIEILDYGVNSFNQQTDSQYIYDERSEDYDFYENARKNTKIANWDKSEMCFCYRMRFVDIDNMKAGRWVVITPYDNIGDFDQVFTYVYELEDGTYSDTNTLYGTNEEFTDIEDLGGLDYAEDIIDSENQFKDEYEVIDNDVDVQEVTNWLNTVVNFIKGTPPMIGVVLAFLPRPILYGMYVVVFLGVIASGIAIVKALI